MAKEDFATPGGSLKLKGVTNSKIDKKKKKKKKEKAQPTNLDPEGSASPSRSPINLESEKTVNREDEAVGKDSGFKEGREAEEEREAGPYLGKTEAEKRYDEMRRKRVCSFRSFWN